MISNLSDETHQALKKLASQHGRSTEAEIQAILDHAVQEVRPFKLGSYLFERSREFGGVDLDIVRDKSPVRATDFE